MKNSRENILVLYKTFLDLYIQYYILIDLSVLSLLSMSDFYLDTKKVYCNKSYLSNKSSHMI